MVLKNKNNKSLESSRVCFVCGSSYGIELKKQAWDLVGLGNVVIGFRICKLCGLVMQDPLVPREIVDRYYTTLSNYTNPGRKGMPTAEKITAVNNQYKLVMDYVNCKGRALQIGCSDGYTLHGFKEQGWCVLGIDPSPSAAAVAKKLWDVDVKIGFFETCQLSPHDKYDVIILTHVLEHVYDPVQMLKTCNRLLSQGGCLLIEIPALIRPDQWPPGYFTFEHVNYFSKTSIKNTLTKSGFDIIGEPSIDPLHTQYPVMRFLACKKKSRDELLTSDYSHAKQICLRYLSREFKQWAQFDKKIAKKITPEKNVIIWGAGIHTSQLLAQTHIEAGCKIQYIVDSDSQKWGLQLGRYHIRSPDGIPYDDENVCIVISSYGAENEIYKSILRKHNLRAQVVRFYTSE